MDLLNEFLQKLLTAGFSKNEIRFHGVEENLKEKIGKTSISKFSQEKGINAGTVSHMLNGKRPVPLELLSLNDVRDKFCSLKNCNNPVRIPAKMDTQLAYLVGVLRDGTVSNEKNGEYCVAFYSKEIEFLNCLSKPINDLFGISPRITKFGPVFGIRMRSQTLYFFFKLLFDMPQYQKDWNTPELIRNSGDDEKRAYISGFFDAEGGLPHVETCNIARKNLYAKFVQKNKESLEFISEHLRKNGIDTGKVYWNDEKHVVKISNKSIPRFSNYIQSLHPWKAKRLAELCLLLS